MFSKSSRCISSFVNLYVARSAGPEIWTIRSSMGRRLLNKSEHNCFGYHVNHSPSDDVVVRVDEQLFCSISECLLGDLGLLTNDLDFLALLFGQST